MKGVPLLILLFWELCNAVVISDPSDLKRDSPLNVHSKAARGHTLNTILNPTLYPALFPFNLHLYEYPQYPLDGAKLFTHIIRIILNIWGQADNPIVHGNMRWGDPNFPIVTYIVQAQRAPYQPAQQLDLRSIAYTFERLAWGFLTQTGLQWSCAIRAQVSRSDVPTPGNVVFSIVIKPSPESPDSTAAVNKTANATMVLSETPMNVLAETDVTVDTTFTGRDIWRRTICSLFYEAIRRLCEKDSHSPCPRSGDIGIARIVSPDGQAQMQVTVLQTVPPTRVLTTFHLGKALLYLLSTYANSGSWKASMSTIRLDGGLAGTVSIEKLPEVGDSDDKTATA